MNAYTQCTRCHGRGYQPEKRKPSKLNPNALGFYARTCPKCGGTGYTHAPVVSQEPAQSPIESRVDELLGETEIDPESCAQFQPRVAGGRCADCGVPGREHA